MKNEPLTESYFYILLCLHAGPNHGYGIMQMAAELSGGRVQIGSGTMYGATGNMMKKGWIAETMDNQTEESSGLLNRRKRLYKLTDAGQAVLQEEIDRLRRLLTSADQIAGKLPASTE